MTTVVPIGRPFTMVQDIVYALPARAVYMSEQGAGTVETSIDGTTWAAPTANVPLAGTFIRSTIGESLISLKTL